MKQFYSRLTFYIGLPFLLTLFICQSASGQLCPNGTTQQPLGFDTTVRIPSGVYGASVKFPSFDSEKGMVTCVKMCVTIIGVVDTVSIENSATNAENFNIRYRRNDVISGPGFDSPPFTNNTNYIKPIALGATDGVPNSGLDFYKNSRDTIVRSTVCRDINDVATISQFYGAPGSFVTYSFDVDVEGYVSGNGSFQNKIETSSLIKFHFEYCTCPAVVLPMNVHSFNVTKLLSNKARLEWSGFDDASEDYKYITEVSRNARDFTAFGTFNKHVSGADPYTTNYTATSGSGVYYFRIRQVYSNGYTRFSNTRKIELENSAGPRFSIYPNPSTGIVGIKFDNVPGVQYGLRIFNALGQVVVTKDLALGSSSYNHVAKLEPGVYWIRVTDKESNESSASQIIIK